MTKTRNGDREAFWRAAIQRRLDRGMTISDFCASEGLKPSAYHYWLRKIKRGDGVLPSQRTDSDNAPTLVPVQLVDDQSGAATVEIVAGNGYLIRVSDRATADHVRRVLQVVDELR